MKHITCFPLALLALSALTPAPGHAQLPLASQVASLPKARTIVLKPRARVGRRFMSSGLRARLKTTPFKTAAPPVVGRKTTSTKSGGFKPKVVALRDTFEGSQTVDEWIDRLPDWRKANPLKEDSLKKLKETNSSEIKDGREHKVQTTDYSITSSPKEIVTFAPVDGFFLGAIVQQQGLALGMGSLHEVPVPATKRAPFILSTNLPMGANFRPIASPSATKTSSAIGELLQAGNKYYKGNSATMQIVDNYSDEQTALSLGIDARYMMVSVNGAFKSNRYNMRHTTTATFIEKAFTATADFEGRNRREAFFNSNFKLADAKKLAEEGDVSPGNLPAYIKSITYGRVMIMNLTSTLSQKDLSVVMGMAANGGVYDVEVDAAFENKVKKSTFELSVTAIGGPTKAINAFADKLKIEDVMAVMSDYLGTEAPLSTMVPISYTVNTLRENNLAALSDTSKYTVTKYTANPIGERYKLNMWVEVTASDDGVADNTFENYGSLMVGGKTWWEIKPDVAKSNKLAKGQLLKITEDVGNHKNGATFSFDYRYDTKPQFKFNLLLRDWDKSSSDDTWFKLDHSLDLKTVFNSKNSRVGFPIKRNDMGGTLYIEVEREEYL